MTYRFLSVLMGLAFAVGFFTALALVKDDEEWIPPPPPIALKGATPDIEQAYQKGLKKVNPIDWSCDEARATPK